MTEAEFISHLELLGWRCQKDEVGDFYCILSRVDHELVVFPVLRRTKDYFVVGLSASLSVPCLAEAISSISGKQSTYAPIAVDHRPSTRLAQPTWEDVARLSDDVLVWETTQSIEENLKRYRELKTDAKGALPLRHLAALALHGEVTKLGEYKQKMMEGDRLGFVPYITLDMVCRAYELAKNGLT